MPSPVGVLGGGTTGYDRARDREVTVDSDVRRAARAAVSARFTGFAPIATCHWQGIANVLAGAGVSDALRILGLSWGVRWKGGGVLYGGGRWHDLLAEVHSVTVELESTDDPAAAEQMEIALSDAGMPFVAEVDAYYLPSPYQGIEHFVHTVVVVERGWHVVTVLDVTNNPAPVAIPREPYAALRSSPCVGRVDPHLLYVPDAAGWRDRPAVEVAARVRADLAEHGSADDEALVAFVAWHAASAEPVDVCRVAAERFQAALLFERLAEREVAGVAGIAEQLRALSDDWYLVHLLTRHPQADQPRQRRRVGRLLTGLRAAERELRNRVVVG
jgi:hypothetical protein